MQTVKAQSKIYGMKMFQDYKILYMCISQEQGQILYMYISQEQGQITPMDKIFVVTKSVCYLNHTL